jgi:hypothetical protein
MVSLDVVYLSLNNGLSLKIVMIVPMKGIIQEIELQRYYNQDFIGPLYLRIALNMLNLVINVKG